MTYLLGQAGDCSSVVFEMTPHQVAGSQGGHQAQLPSQDGAGHHPGELGSVLACRQGMSEGGRREGSLTRVNRMGTLHSQHLQARGLGWQDGAASNSSNLRDHQTIVSQN